MKKSDFNLGEFIDECLQYMQFIHKIAKVNSKNPNLNSFNEGLQSALKKAGWNACNLFLQRLCYSIMDGTYVFEYFDILESNMMKVFSLKVIGQEGDRERLKFGSVIYQGLDRKTVKDKFDYIKTPNGGKFVISLKNLKVLVELADADLLDKMSKEIKLSYTIKDVIGLKAAVKILDRIVTRRLEVREQKARRVKEKIDSVKKVETKSKPKTEEPNSKTKKLRVVPKAEQGGDKSLKQTGS
ncbi:hypothetical protein COB64_02980 [Candidatus Wolfebacteria bacterium]|nr:MAG: hypothetical protein COB64_02980 [Candidatus Wolfebacteria bacterium]